ncbi:MAG: SLBB domain-containing protein [Terracidiphilus sp.]
MSTAIGSISESPAGGYVAKTSMGVRPALTVLDLITLLASHWRLLAKAALVGAVAGLALAFLLPTRYTAVTTILPPSSSSSLASLFAAQSGELGAVAGFTGGNFGFRSPAEVCLIMLRSRTVEDATIQRFQLMQEYSKKRVSDARTALERRTSVTLNMKSGIIAISATDGNAARAAELANGYVNEFKKFSASLAITEASQRRLFFEQQLLEAKGSLTQAEEALKNTQQTTGLLEPAGASKALLESAVAVRAQIAAKQVQLRSMRTYATEENPRLIQVKQEIAALESQLAELTGTSPEAADDPLVPKGDMPEAGAEYLRRLRDVKYNESVVALLARQLEIARLDEARQGAVIQVVDLAVTPDKRSSPKRLAILLASIVLALCSASFWIVYASRDISLPMKRAAYNGAALLLALFAMTHVIAAQTPESPGQSAPCSTSADGSQEAPCADPEQNTSAVPSSPRDQGDHSRLASDTDRPVRDARSNAEDALTESARGQARRAPHEQTPEPRTEFEQMVADSAGRPLEVFGRSLFAQPPATFAPAGDAQVPSDYVLGPGDQLRIRIWGQIDADLRIEVDRSGRIYIPHVGEVPVAGIQYRDLDGYLKQAVERIYKNFNLDVAIERLHSIQIFIVGQAETPGVYTISSLSTLVNAVFASGGPSSQGSLRHIQLRRGDSTVQDFDLYDLILKGDKSHDHSLQSGDVVFIPPVGPLAAITGSVNIPAIYELRDNTTIGSLIELAGGLNTVADGSTAVVERIGENRSRNVLQFPLDASGLGFALRGGDIVHISSIVPRFDDTVTLRGYVTNPGRYPFRPGMHVRDLIPNPEALLPREYWLNRASITDGRQTEYPVRKQVPDTSSKTSAQDQLRNAGSSAIPMQQKNQAPSVSGNSSTRQQTIPEYYSEIAHSETIRDPGAETATAAGIAAGNELSSGKDTLARDLERLAPSVNWRYALIQRVDAASLKTQLISFDLGKAIEENDPASNLALAPGDIVTVFSQQEIVAPEQARTRYIKVEGEVEHPGIYQLEEGETLKDVLESAGGLTARAYPFGARLTRESARIEQQKGLDEMVRTAEAEMRASTVSVVAASAQDAGGVAASQAAQQTLLASLRSVQASGRVVLDMHPVASGIADFPPIVLEDSDRIVIPARPNTITVSGAVYNPASFVYDARRSVGDYLDLAGKGRINSNRSHAFVLRADGTVISRQEVGGLFHSSFERLPLNPGDQIVVPEKVDNGVGRALHDWPQILTSLAISALAVGTFVP